MSEMLRQGTVTTRRAHKCHGCRKDIPRGSRVESCACVHEGVAYTLHTCAACSALFASLPADSFDPDEGVTEGWAKCDALAEKGGAPHRETKGDTHGKVMDH